MKTIIYKDSKDRLYWIDEKHPSTTDGFATCRIVEGEHLKHTVVRTRDDLKPYLLTDIDLMTETVLMTKPIESELPLTPAVIEAAWESVMTLTMAEVELVTLEARLTAPTRNNIKKMRYSIASTKGRLRKALQEAGHPWPSAEMQRLNAQVEDGNKSS